MTKSFYYKGFSSPNGTIVPDEVFDVLLPELTDAELRVLLYIIRRTFGFKRNSDDISLRQMVEGITTKDGRVLDRGAGLSKAGAAKALKGLVAKGIIVAKRNSSPERGNEPTTYALRFENDPSLSTTWTRGGLPGRQALVHQVDTQQTVKQQTDINHSSIRGESSQKNEEAGKPTQGRSQPLVSYEEFRKLQAAHQQQPESVDESREALPPETESTPEQSAPAQPQRLNRQYLREARAKSQHQPAQGMTALASMLPNLPQHMQRTYSEERQVLVDVIADLAREFKDEAKLTESVSRAYNLMQQAKISDIGVFTSKIYEARSITKERYGTINRRMPYFFSVLADVCGIRQKTPQQKPPSG